MSNYTLSIKNYQAIKEATIELNGITVLAGVNGSGKSTLSRWLYYVVNGMCGFEASQRKQLIRTLRFELQRIKRMFNSLGIQARFIDTIDDKLISLRYGDDALDEDALRSVFGSFVAQVRGELNKFMESATGSQKQRIARYLDSSEENIITYETSISNYLMRCEDILNKGIERYKNKTREYLISDLNITITDDYNNRGVIPETLEFEEGGQSLLGEHSFSLPLSVRRAIYVDSPMAVTHDSYSDYLWSNFKSYLLKSNTDKTERDQSLDKEIQRIIGGSITLEDDSLGIEKEIHFIDNRGLDIEISEAATGIKSFAYISRLIENGWLDKETILLIDEPEAHLHPQWIVEFARLLVLINKNYGTNIMIASHNPDMVAAIQSIALKEGIQNNTRFYLAQKDKFSSRYSFNDKGFEIGDIFSSFNIAVSRIEQYGESALI